MHQASLLDRLGIVKGPGDPRLAWRVIAVLLLAYVTSFAFFYPRVATNTDEAMYLRQTQLVLEGHSTVENLDPLTGGIVEHLPSSYSIGTPMLMAPFVWVGGWRAAYVVPVTGLVLAVIFLGLWLRDAGHSPLYALLVLGYPPSLVMGRVAMSDAPSMGLMAFGLWLFWRGQDRGWPLWLGAGFVAGASTSLRLMNALIFAPLFAGTVLRRETKAWALVVGGLAGLAVRALAMGMFFGDAMYERGIYYFEPETLGDRVPFFLLGLAVFVPGGIVLALANRGRRWPELSTTIVLFFCFYAFQKFSTWETSFSKRIVLGLRYFMPLLPLMVFAMAEPLQRLWAMGVERISDARRRRLEAAASALLVVWIAGVGAASVVVHPAYSAWSSTQAELRDAIHEHVRNDLPLLTNWPATRKFLRDLDRRFLPLDLPDVSASDIDTLLERHGSFTLAVLDRSDSAFWLAEREKNAAFLAALEVPHELVYDRQVTSTDRLRIWRVAKR